MKIKTTFLELYKSFKLLVINIKAKKNLKIDNLTKLKRRQICKNCEFVKKDSKFLWFKADRCAICTCFIKPKTLLRFESCPKAKW